MPTPDAERRRVETLRQYAILDTPPEPAFDDVVGTAARLFSAPIAFISLIDETREWLKASVGIDLQETGRGCAFCTHAVEAGRVLVVPDAAADPRFALDPLVVGKPGVRFYAAAPLMTRDGQALGALCIMDTKPRPPLTQEASGALEALARVVIAEFEARRAMLKMAAWSARLERLSGIALKLSRCVDRTDVLQTAADEALLLFGAHICSVRIHLDGGRRETASAGFDQLTRNETAAARTIVDHLEAAMPRSGSIIRVSGAGLRARAKTKGVVLPTLGRFDSWMAAPLRCDSDTCSGTMIVAGDEPFRIEDEAILGQLAQLLTGALHNRLLLDRAQAAESHFRILFERNPNPMWVYDRETLRFLEVNDAAIELYGWSQEQFREMTVLDLRLREDVPRLLETLKEMGQTQRHHGEWRHITRDGRGLDVLVAAYYGMEHNGRPVGLTVVHDISERKRVEQALAESEARFRNIADTIPGMLWVTDADGKAIFVNRQWREYTGCTQEHDDAAGWQSYLHPEDLEGVLASVNAAAELRRPFSVNYRLRRHDGEHRWFLDTGSPRIAPDGSLLGYIGVALDVTDQRRLESDLRQAQKMQAVGQLTGGIAHDFNNLLTVILGNSELIAAEAANDPYLSQLSEMTRKAADRGAGLVRRLLAFSRRQTLQPRVTDINCLITDMNDMLLRVLGEDVDVAFALPDSLWPACIDPEQLETALLNLVINARDAMSESGRMMIETANLMVTGPIVGSDEPVAPGDYLSITVTDNGTGMAPEVLARAFEPFFTTKEVGKGTGLGLSMVYGFVKQSDGYVSLSSEPGAGTTVRLLLPRAALGADLTAPAGEAASTPSGSGQTILLVEDEPLVRSMLAEQLKRLGYGVVEASNGPSALAVLDEREDIDLLLTDMVMPAGMNGRQLAEAAMTLRPELRFLFMSGHTDDRLALQGRLPGGQPLLRKPVGKKVLAEALRAALAAEAA